MTANKHSRSLGSTPNKSPDLSRRSLLAKADSFGILICSLSPRDRPDTHCLNGCGSFASCFPKSDSGYSTSWRNKGPFRRPPSPLPQSRSHSVRTLFAIIFTFMRQHRPSSLAEKLARTQASFVFASTSACPLVQLPFMNVHEQSLNVQPFLPPPLLPMVRHARHSPEEFSCVS